VGSSENLADQASFEKAFQERMRRPDVVAEYFFPLGYAHWDKGRFILPKHLNAEVRSAISGVRLQTQDPQDPSVARQCQQDLGNLISSLMQLRAMPQLQGLILSERFLITPQAGSGNAVRIKFGLQSNPRYGEQYETRAARCCYRRLKRAIHKAGFAVKATQVFKPKTGMAGLLQWADTLYLSARRPLWPWFLVLLLLLPVAYYFIPLDPLVNAVLNWYRGSPE
jgi:hypothetical protein